MKRIPVGLRKLGRPVSTVSAQRGCQSLRLDQLSQGPLYSWSISHEQSRCWRGTRRQRAEGQTGGEERCDVQEALKPSEKSLHEMLSVFGFLGKT